MAKNYSKLVPKKITDKSGRTTTVWVKPGQDVKGKKAGKAGRDYLKLLPKELAEKVRRRGRGQGSEIKMTKKEVDTILKKGIVGFVSSDPNPTLEEHKNMSEEQINKRRESLKRDLIQDGYKFVPAKGMYEGEEDSFIVMINDTDRDYVTKLGDKYDQDSVIYSEQNNNEMIFTHGKNKGKRHKGEGFKFLSDKTQDYYTEIDMGGKRKKFSLNFDFEKLVKSITDAFKLLING